MVRNVILLTIDAFRRDCVGFFGSRPTLTPNLDKLAAHAMTFTQAVALGGWTRPSITGLLSSTFPSMYGGSWGGFHENRPSLAEILQGSDITTVAFNTNPQIGALYGFDRGFDVFEELHPTHSGFRWADVRGMQLLLRHPYFHVLINKFGIETTPPAITATAEELTDKLLNWLSHRSEPFFAWVHYMDAHWPYHISHEISVAQEAAQAWVDLHVMHVCEKHNSSISPGGSQLQNVKEAYQNAVKYIDKNLGRLLRHLEGANLLDNTAIIITADHGEEFFEHGRWGHYQLYDENVLVPLVLWVPGGSGSGMFRCQVSLLDVAPTILDLLGSQANEKMLGKSLLRFFDSAATITSTEAYTESMWSDNYRLAIRTENHKYLYEAKSADNPRLYNLKLDSDEKINVVRQDLQNARRFAALRRRHAALAEESNKGIVAEDVEVDKQIRERLRSLGYLE